MNLKHDHIITLHTHIEPYILRMWGEKKLGKTWAWFSMSSASINVRIRIGIYSIQCIYTVQSVYGIPFGAESNIIHDSTLTKE